MRQLDQARALLSLGWSLIFALTLASSVVAEAQWYQPATNRPGADYKDFGLERPSPALCQSACEQDPACKAWTYVRPGVQGEQARCWLKNAVPEAVADDNCVSGVRRPPKPGPPAPVEPPRIEMEPDVNRPGGDYHDFELETADPMICGTACADQPRCLSWTYVKPGVQGERAHCWLKSEVPEPVEDDNCVSGLRPVPPPPPPPAPEEAEMEPDVDRPGSDFAGFDLAAPDPVLCQQACAKDARCRAWTFVRPGVQGDKPRCYLKNPAPDAIHAECCISGLK
jgi:1-phosphatidylinositol phosphodiesterase